MFRRASLLTVAALLACASAQTASPSSTPPPVTLRQSTCYKSYLSIYHFINDAGTQEYSYNLKPLCNIDRSLAVPIPKPPSPVRYWYFLWAIAGNVSRQTFACNPAWGGGGSKTYFSSGSFIQTYDWDKPAPAPNPGQTDPETGLPVKTTVPCIIFAHDRPEFDLIDESNPATGGIRLSYSGLTEPSSDNYNACPASDIYGGGESPRFLHINLHCDPNQEDLSTGASLFSEVSPCVYELNATSKYACGVSGDPFMPATAQAAADTPGRNFGYTVLGAVLTIVAYAGFLWLDARGHLDFLRARLPSSLGGHYNKTPASASSYGFSAAGGSSSAAAYGSA